MGLQLQCRYWYYNRITEIVELWIEMVRWIFCYSRSPQKRGNTFHFPDFIVFRFEYEFECRNSNLTALSLPTVFFANTKTHSIQSVNEDVLWFMVDLMSDALNYILHCFRIHKRKTKIKLSKIILQIELFKIGFTTKYKAVTKRPWNKKPLISLAKQSKFYLFKLFCRCFELQCEQVCKLNEENLLELYIIRFFTPFFHSIHSLKYRALSEYKGQISTESTIHQRPNLLFWIYEISNKYSFISSFFSFSPGQKLVFIDVYGHEWI